MGQQKGGPTFGNQEIILMNVNDLKRLKFGGRKGFEAPVAYDDFGCKMRLTNYYQGR